MKFKLFPVIFFWSFIIHGNETNPFCLDTVIFNQQNFSFTVEWHIDSDSETDNHSPGITFSCGQNASTPPLNNLKTISGDSTFKISDLMFDTTYYIELWSEFNNSWIKPDSQSIKKIRVFSSVRQPVKLFETSTTDTVKALNDNLIMYIDSTYPLGLPPYKDTVERFTLADSILKNGFVRYSKAIKFEKPAPVVPFFISIIPDSIPENRFRKEQLRIFRDSSGVLLCEKESFFDKENNRVTVKTRNLKLPFIILADTSKPEIEILSDTSQCIKSRSLYDTLQITDNCANINWSYYCAPGSQLPVKPEKSGVFQKKSGLITGMIPSSGAQLNGMRAVYIISDGTFTDTIRLSRRGIRDYCDPFTTLNNSITPLFTTSTLDKPGIKDGLEKLFKKSGNKYDKSVFRIYRWYPDKSNKTQENKWIEYSSKNRDLFTITPGVLLWLITNEPFLIDFGQGTSVSLIDTVNVLLRSKQWTDFSNPYGFNLSLTNIINSSGIVSENITVYKWLKDPDNKTYRAELLYDNSVSSSHDTIHAMEHGYTVYNKSDSAINLSLAPIPYQSDYSENVLHKKQALKSQTICVSIFNKTGKYGSVYCGIHQNNNDTISSAPPPSFGTTPIRIKSGNNSYGILSCPATKNSPAVFDLEINTDDTRDIKLSADLIDTNSDLHFALFCNGKNGLKKNSGNQISLDNDINTVHLAAGSNADIESFQNENNLKTTQPIPSINIHYSKNSISLRLCAIKKSQMQLELFSLDGKLVKKITYQYSGINIPVLKIPLNLRAGVYIAKVLFKEKGSTVYSNIHKFSNFTKRY